MKMPVAERHSIGYLRCQASALHEKERMSYLNHKNQRRSLRHSATMVAALVSIAVPGCGPDQQGDPNRAVVSGVVTYNGKPLPAGTISFESTDPPMASSALIR